MLGNFKVRTTLNMTFDDLRWSMFMTLLEQTKAGAVNLSAWISSTTEVPKRNKVQFCKWIFFADQAFKEACIDLVLY